MEMRIRIWRFLRPEYAIAFTILSVAIARGDHLLEGGRSSGTSCHDHWKKEKPFRGGPNCESSSGLSSLHVTRVARLRSRMEEMTEISRPGVAAV